MAEITRKDFIEELKAMKERMDELFLCNLGTAGDEAESRAQEEAPWMPSADMLDGGKEILYLLDLPGVCDDDLQIECKDDSLRVSGRRAGENLAGGHSISVERPRGAFLRVFKLPCPVRREDIRAELKKGVLRVVVPKELCSGGRRQKVRVRREQ